MAKTWAEIDERRKKLRISKAGLARDAGISETALHTGLRLNTGMKLATAKLLEQVLDAAEQEQEARDAAE